MNNGNANMVFGNQGYLSFLQGRFSDEKVENYEQAVEAILPMAELLGLSAGSEFFAVYGARDSQGYTYYTFQQRYGELTIAYAGLKIMIDPDGYTAGLSSSFVPNIGLAEETEEIGAEAAEAVVLEAQAGYDLTIYSEATHKVAYSNYGQMVNAYAVYSNNPNSDAQDFDMKYYKYGNRHFWCRGYYVSTVGRNRRAIEQYIRNQLQEDLADDQMTLKEYIDPFTGEPVREGK